MKRLLFSLLGAGWVMLLAAPVSAATKDTVYIVFYTQTGSTSQRINQPDMGNAYIFNNKTNKKVLYDLSTGHLDTYLFDRSTSYDLVFRFPDQSSTITWHLPTSSPDLTLQVTYDTQKHRLIYRSGGRVITPRLGNASRSLPTPVGTADKAKTATASTEKSPVPTTADAATSAAASTTTTVASPTPNNNIDLGLPIPTTDGTIDHVTNYQEYLRALFRGAQIIASILAVVMIIVGGYQYVVSQGDPGRTGQAKEIVAGALTGIMLLILSNSFLQLLFTSLPTKGSP